MNYYIADCHFGDTRVIKFCHRPFSSIEEMDRIMIQNWNRVVREFDDVYIVGDLVYRTTSPAKYLSQLNGRLHLICGNHDDMITKNPELRKYFVEICDYLVIHDRGHRLVLFHYPLLEWDGFYFGSWHIYGHIHNHPSLNQEKSRQIFKALNCGVDIIGFTPRTFDELVSFNKKDCERMKRPEGAV